MAAHRKPHIWLCCALLSVIGPLLIAACGSSSSAPSSTTPAANGQVHSSLVGRDIVSNGVSTQRPKRGTGGSELNDDNPARADSGNGKATGQNPCALVSKAQAQAIVGAPIATPQEAPLGPTCIYERRGGGDLITVAVESLEFAKIRSKIHDTMRATLAGRTAYCGNYGRPTTFVPLAHGMVLNVAAPCAVGTRFAEEALRQLGSSL